VSSFKVSFLPKQIELICEDEESIYEAASRQGIRMPISCRNGVCHICRAQLLEGEIETRARRTRAENSPVEIMVCQAKPVSDCILEMKNIYGQGELPVNEYSCRVVELKLIGQHVYQVELELPAGRLPERFAGQYLSLAIPEEGIESFFSIANAPEGRRLELHIQADPHLESAVKIIRALEVATTVKVTLPMGKAGILGRPEGEVILMAAGTGFAQMKAIIEQLLSWESQVPIFLYWGVRTDQEMYLRELAERWQSEYENFHFTPLVANVEGGDDGAHFEQLANAVLQQPHDLSSAQIYISGSPRLVYRSMDVLEGAGAAAQQFKSDVFEYASRPDPGN